ncbi:MAG: putative 2OG-Fe(II) oxygenase [Xanthomonadales bacterium]|nr:putative 2OG-Fe(II) oxygenase [Xanthomonadales bacterium]
MEITAAFAVPLARSRLPDCEALNAELRALFLAREAEGARYRNPEPLVARNQALYESVFNLFDWPHPAVRRLRDFCLGELFRLVAELNGHDAATVARLRAHVECWFHVTRRGGWFGVHNHALHSWSGVYCVRHDGDDPESDSGRLVFINPNQCAAMFADPGNARMRPPFAIAPLKLRLRAGELVLFPSWLLHEVLPYEGDSERITVAFNARFRDPGVRPPELPLG